MSADKVHRLLRIGLNVVSLERAIDFYAGALGFGVESQDEAPDGRLADLKLGQQALRLMERAAPGRAYPEPRVANDPWFQHFAIAVNDMDAAYARLSGHGAQAISDGGPVALPPSTGSVVAYKFRDPDGHPLELSFAPKSHWMDPADNAAEGPFLGIDHSAVAVSDLDASLGFWRDRLGLKLADRLVNQSPTQARLDGLEAPVVDILVLEFPAGGPHIELLHYRAPATQAPRPVDEADIAATWLELEGGSAPQRLQDPDGHRIRLQP